MANIPQYACGAGVEAEPAGQLERECTRSSYQVWFESVEVSLGGTSGNFWLGGGMSPSGLE